MRLTLTGSSAQALAARGVTDRLNPLYGKALGVRAAPPSGECKLRFNTRSGRTNKYYNQKFEIFDADDRRFRFLVQSRCEER